MKLSIIIVNYNVSCFLEQALKSVYHALKNIEAEVFVVDNHSEDDSLEMLKEKFPQVQLIANKENVGFARANNQAIRMSQGEYVLLLNPDTLVEEDTFEKCLDFMDATPDAGGLGVKMINGHGEFLPESKRGIPFPAVAFYKLFGLSKLFPNSHKFGTYHLTYLDNDEVHSVEVLSGAFMMMRKKVLDEVGLLDEDYFMYGEDIDLSYRILKGGYKNYYFPHTRIIHYKGESTKKGSLNYVHVFYKAMQIFAKKHFSTNNAKIFNALINCAIWFRASLAAIKRIAAHLFLPLTDFALVYAGMFGLAKYWEMAVLSGRESSFPTFYYYLVIPLYILIWMFAIFVCKGYQKPVRLSGSNKGIVLGTVSILLIYALLPESLRFSRAVLLLGTMWTIIAVNVVRSVSRRLSKRNRGEGESIGRRVAVVGNPDEARRVLNLVRMMDEKCDFWSIITVQPDLSTDKSIIGHLSQIDDIVSLYHINEVVFCSRDLPAKTIIEQMWQFQDRQLEMKIAPEGSTSIIGSNAIFSSETPSGVRSRALTQRNNLIRKRLFDVCSALLLLLFLFIDIWFVKQKTYFICNLFQVLVGQKSWVGLSQLQDETLSKLKNGVLHPTDAFLDAHFTPEMQQTADQLYVSDYSVRKDVQILMRAFAHLGR